MVVESVADAEDPLLNVHEYVDAPEAVKTALFPLQILGSFTVTVGTAFIVMATEPEFVQPV
ncbi:MAG: hypothetical protein EBV15_10745, partial [Bacteroidetes bacterium]|nr:hypothetical protein [Bacteroidota bacterium]